MDWSTHSFNEEAFALEELRARDLLALFVRAQDKKRRRDEWGLSVQEVPPIGKRAPGDASIAPHAHGQIHQPLERGLVGRRLPTNVATYTQLLFFLRFALDWTLEEEPLLGGCAGAIFDGPILQGPFAELVPALHLGVDKKQTKVTEK